MTSAELYQWIADPSLLNKETLAELKQLTVEFPYFHAVRMLYLKNLAVLNDVRLDKELKRMAVFIPDRRKLFRLIDSRLARSKKKPAAHSSIPVVAADYAGWLEQNAMDLPVEDGQKTVLDSIIENIESENSQKARMTGEKNTLKDAENADKSETDAADRKTLDDSYFTETLARVYISQKKYDKALEIIRVLSLKYPEKNIYFADQIRYLEKIININK